MWNLSVNYIISLNTCHRQQHGCRLYTEQSVNKGGNHNKSGPRRTCGRRVNTLIYRTSSTMFMIQVLVTIVRDNITDTTVGCVVFIVTYSHTPLVLWQTDVLEPKNCLLNWQTSYVQFLAQFSLSLSITLHIFFSNTAPWGKPEGPWLQLSISHNMSMCTHYIRHVYKQFIHGQSLD